eukprot:jgi/Mesen1/4752/ME000242S03928
MRAFAHFKEAALAYAVLLHAGRPLSVKELGDECERFLHRRFNEQVQPPSCSPPWLISPPPPPPPPPLLLI